MRQFKDFGIITTPVLVGKVIPIKEIFGIEIIVYFYEIKDSKYNGKCLYLQISVKDIKRVVFTNAKALIEDIKKIPVGGFPFKTIIIKEERRFIFT